jgi:hypothetical protein
VRNVEEGFEGRQVMANDWVVGGAS